VALRRQRQMCIRDRYYIMDQFTYDVHAHNYDHK
jgi:hypothetical protein